MAGGHVELAMIELRQVHQQLDGDFPLLPGQEFDATKQIGIRPRGRTVDNIQMSPSANDRVDEASDIALTS
jgi:hypothetical protein